ncbi:hypothetical protein [Leucobacter luti]|uniref:hypothetical protein n=1 Tax=Leucobacter luti TaxID=340320 RepID=UPI003D02DBA8
MFHGAPEVVSGPLHEAVHRVFALGATLIVAQPADAVTALVTANRACADVRVTWTPVILERSRVEIGPWVTPGIGGSYEDYLARRVAAGGPR